VLHVQVGGALAPAGRALVKDLNDPVKEAGEGVGAVALAVVSDGGSPGAQGPQVDGGPAPLLAHHPHLGLRKPPGHTILSLLLHRLDPEELQEALLRVFPGADLGEVLVVDGKHLRGSGKGKSPQVRLVEVLALGLRTTLAQAKAEGLKGKVGDTGYLYPELAGKVVQKGGRTSSS
jgi:fructokinase